MNRNRFTLFVAAVLAGSTTLFSYPPNAIAAQNDDDEVTVWVPPPVGSHLGGGYVKSGRKVAKQKEAAAPAPTSDDSPLGRALSALDAQGGAEAEGWGMLAFAVSVQTKVPVDTLSAQQKASGLSYGELLVANSLAEASGKSFQQILALKGKQSWSALAAQLHVSQRSLIARAKAATDAAKYAQARRDRRREQNIRDTTLSRPLPTNMKDRPGGG